MSDAEQRKAIKQRYRQMREAKRSHPYARWIAVLDPRTCETCRNLNGKVFSIDDPGWPKHLPPIHKGCRCRIGPVRRSQIDEDSVEQLADYFESPCEIEHGAYSEIEPALPTSEWAPPQESVQYKDWSDFTPEEKRNAFIGLAFMIGAIGAAGFGLYWFFGS
jgi:hypothetical protein